MLSLSLRRRRSRRLSALRKRSLRRQYTNRDDGHEKKKQAYNNNVDVRPYQSRDDQSLIDVPCGKLDSVFMHLSVKCP